MINIINSGQTIKKIINLLPDSISYAIQSAVKDLSLIEEIHLKKGENVFLRIGGRTRAVDAACSDETMETLLSSMIGGSLYAHSETIRRGYISFENGVRIGVCGSAVCEGNNIIAIDKISSLNIRVPHVISGISMPIISALERSGFNCGLLIYSLPGVGKTTVLRDIAMILSDLPYRKRISLIDSRRELYYESNNHPTLDVYSGYPPGDAIEMAVRTMSPEIIICDEIGGTSETDALHSLAGKGIPVIASAHSGSANELMYNSNIAKLHNDRLFSWYVGIKRTGRDIKYDFIKSEEIGS